MTEKKNLKVIETIQLIEFDGCSRACDGCMFVDSGECPEGCGAEEGRTRIWVKKED